MSKRTTQLEAEDVVSSIRRLVSYETISQQEPDPVQATERLVLTSALRVEPEAPSESGPSEASIDTFILRDAILPDTDAPSERSPVKNDVSEDDAPVTAAPGEEPSAASVLSAKIAALETAIGKISSDWEPEGAGDGEYSGTEAPALEWKDDVELDATGAPIGAPLSLRQTPEPVRTNAAETLPFVPGVQTVADADEDDFDDDIIDEETLRAMVAEIVRSELQGELGERITRNVRKLVRREIHRALASKDLA